MTHRRPQPATWSDAARGMQKSARAAAVRYAAAPMAMLVCSPVAKLELAANSEPPNATPTALPIWRVVLNRPEAVPE